MGEWRRCMESEHNKVKIWEERVSIPTYGTGRPNKNPMFLEKRVYQGSSGVVYPHQVIDKILDEKTDVQYDVVFLENEYLKIMIMPSLGGRVQMAYDKKNDYHFVYYNRVIKPALVGLTGPWISGGIEFNWPQHHRPSTFEPVDYSIAENGDGSVTLWVSEVELMFRTKGMAGFTLYPDRAYLEITGKVYNRTDQPRTFLWWANPALVVNDDYQSVFPPDVYAVMDHGKRDVSRFPIAVGTYYKMDYSAGVDISRYRNLKVPTSYMVHESKFDFIGGYDHGRQAGMLHVADRHIVPGKKQWVWGSGDFGQAWDRNLTDEDGPYAELMTGVFTDNQPDFSWLRPYEEKSFTQYFMPYKKIGVVKNADEQRAVSLELRDGMVRAGIYASAGQEELKVLLTARGSLLHEEKLSLAPGDTWEYSVPCPAGCEEHELSLSLYEGGACVLLYKPEKYEIKDMPKAAEAAPAPEDIRGMEELYLTGLHVEQYRHATRRAEDYYREGLKRDPGDSRCNNALGRLLLAQCRYPEAEKHFQTAVRRITFRNPNPYDGEPYYNLGLALIRQDRIDEAFEAFYKAVWNDAWKGPAYYQLGVIDCIRGQYEAAAAHLKKALVRNYHNHKARNLLSAVYRSLGRTEDALTCCRLTRSIDLGDWGSLYEMTLLEQTGSTGMSAVSASAEIPDNTGDAEPPAGNAVADAAAGAAAVEAVSLSPAFESAAGQSFLKLMRDSDNNYLELSLDYSAAGFYREALDLLDLLISRKGAENCSPLISYHRAWFIMKTGSGDLSAALEKAAGVSPDGCFPWKQESMRVLLDALDSNPEDSRACYYLGNYHYALRNYDEAISFWQTSVSLNDEFPTVHRNLALALMNKRDDREGCRRHLERAYELDRADSRVLYELDQYYKLVNRPLPDRLGFLEDRLEVVEDRDDLYLEYCALLNGTGRYAEALEKILARHFHPWEGGEGKVPGQYKKALTGLAVEAIGEGRFDDALAFLDRCRAYPHSLGEGKLYGTLENDIDYLSGLARAGKGDREAADSLFEQAARGPSEPVSAMYYNDQPPHMIFFQGLALRELGRIDEAASRFNKLIDYGEKHINDQVVIDYFAVSLPDFLVFDVDMNEKNRIHCLFMLTLGHSGRGEKVLSVKYLEELLASENHHDAGFVLGCDSDSL